MPQQNEIPNRVSVRTDPSEGYAHRFETISTAREILDETSQTSAILGACEHLRADQRGKAAALSYLAERLPPEQLAEVAQRLSTPQLPLGVCVALEPCDDEVSVETSFGE